MNLHLWLKHSTHYRGIGVYVCEVCLFRLQQLNSTVHLSWGLKRRKKNTPLGMCGNVFVLASLADLVKHPFLITILTIGIHFVDVTSGMGKDPADVLDRQKCLDALAALRHAKWFQVRNIILLSYCSLMRCIYIVFPFYPFGLRIVFNDGGKKLSVIE